MGRISMFLRYRSCVLLYKSACYKVITYLQETYSVLSTQFLGIISSQKAKTFQPDQPCDISISHDSWS